MDKKEEFKKFIRSKPELINLVKNKEYSWQDFYEVYDIYGEDNNAWDKYNDNKNTNDEPRNNSINELTNIVKNLNLDNVQKYINNAQKAINVISELTSTKNNVVPPIVPKTPRVINKFFGD